MIDHLSHHLHDIWKTLIDILSIFPTKKTVLFVASLAVLLYKIHESVRPRKSAVEILIMR